MQTRARDPQAFLVSFLGTKWETWRTLNAINLNTGKYVWKIPLGEYPALVAQVIKDTGTENCGGPIVTAGGLVFISATNFDKKIRAFDKNTGKRHTAIRKDRIRFAQKVFDANTGYGYSYVKVLRLQPGKPRLVIEHVLTNTGKKPFTTQVYDHNFVTMSPGNADLVITVPFAINPPARLPPVDVARVEGSSITYLRPMTGQDRATVQIAGFGPGAGDYSFRIANTHTGASVEVKGDRPLMALSLFSIRSTVAVEPTITMDLAPGAEKRWSYMYTYTAPRAAP